MLTDVVWQLPYVPKTASAYLPRCRRPLAAGQVKAYMVHVGVVSSRLLSAIERVPIAFVH